MTKNEILEIVLDKIEYLWGFSRVEPDTNLFNAGADSLDMIEMTMELEETFNIDIPDDALETLEATPNSITEYLYERFR